MDDYSKMKYDIHDLPKGEYVVDKYPELLDYPEFSDKDNDHLLRIAFLATDEESPLVNKYRDDYEKRLKSVFEILKIDNKELFNDIVLNNNPDYSVIVNRFFVMCDNLAYVMWSNMMFNFHLIGVALRQPPNMKDMVADMKKRADLQHQQSDIHEELIKYEALIFPDYHTRKIARKEIAKILQMPEKHAQERVIGVKI